MTTNDSTFSTSDREVSNLESIERIILQNMNEGVITLECNGSIFTANQSAVRILGLDGSDLKGRGFEEVFPHEERNDAFRHIFDDAIHRGITAIHRDVVFRRPDGQDVDLSVSASFIEADVCLPELQTVVVVFRDITAIKSLERMKRRAIDHLSHELKTPLAVINATLEVLTTGKDLEPAAERKLDRIGRHVARLQAIQEIVEEILEHPAYRAQPIDAVSAVNRTMDRVRDEASHRSVMLEADVEQTETHLIDPDVLDLILHTLIKNAIECSPDGSRVTVSLKTVPEGVLLTVQDRGIGIPIADQEFIFEGFHHTLSTDLYTTGKPFGFGAGGKGLELLRLKVFSETYPFDVSFESTRCRYIPHADDECPGDIAQCPHVEDAEGCRKSGGTIFRVLFYEGNRA